MKVFNKLILIAGFLALLCQVEIAWASDCYSVSPASGGNWSDPSNWEQCGNSFPGSNDTVEITNGSPITLDRNATVLNITIDNGAILNTDNNNRVLTLTTTAPLFTVASGGTFAPGNSTVVMNRSNANVVLTAGAITFNNLQLTPTLPNSNRIYTFGSGAITVNGDFLINPTKTNGSTRSLTVNMGAPITVAGTTTIQVTGGRATAELDTISAANSLTTGQLNIGASSTLTANASSITLNGATGPLFTLTGTFNQGTSTVTMSSPNSVQLTSGSAITFDSLSINMPGKTGALGTNAVVNNQLLLVNGVVTTGSNTLSASVKNCTATAVQRAGGFVNGNLKLKFPAGSNTCRFDVGSGAAYTPIDVTTPTSSSGGTLTGSTTGSEHPNIANSGIDATKDANRYWTLSGDTINAANYAITFNFDSGDTDAAATPANFIIAKYDGSAWSKPSSITAAASSTRSASVPGPLTNAGFAVGESLFVCSVPPGMPSTMTCVCDNFGRTSLNPSTIYGGNWTLSGPPGAAPDSFVPIIDKDTGNLRLTDNSQNVSTAATVPGTFPAAGNLITVEFKHYAYNGNGADGIALTLSDASQPPTPGAYGGSLGYAQKDNASCATSSCNGFVGGWIGVGIDEFGNYSNPSEGRNGGPGSRPDAVAVRGSGTGLSGYPYLDGTGSLGPGVDHPSSITPDYGHSYRITVDARCYQSNSNPDIACNNPSHARKTQVMVNRDTSGAGNFSDSNKIVDFDAYVKNPSQADVPQNWKLSFTGSTGSLVNIHELQGLKICAQTITPPAGYRIQVDNLSPSTCATPGGSPASPTVTITALDTSGNTVTTYAKTISLKALLSNGDASNAGWLLKSGNGTLSGNQYTFVAADQGVAQFYLTDSSQQTVYVSASENGGTLSSTFGSGIQFSGSNFTIENIDSLHSGEGGGVVAGRAHLMRVTRGKCSSSAIVNTDTSFSGYKNLGGWYTKDSSHPVNALAPQICQTNTTNPSTGTCSSPSGNTLGLCQPLLSEAHFIPALNFSQGVATFCLATNDVGKYSINLRDDLTATPVIGISDMLTVRPFAVAVTDIKQGTVSNPGSTGDPSMAGSLFTTAGSNFQATIGGYLWNSAGDTNNDGVPDAFSNKAQVTGGGIAPHYADAIQFSAGSSVPTASQGGITGTLLPDTVAVSDGSTTVTSLNYSEVGSFSLVASPPSNAKYLNSVDLTNPNRIVIFSSGSSPNAWVGRFKPDHFKLASSTITPRATASCSSASSFTYMGEPIGIEFKLEAWNKNGVTQNYTGAWAPLNTTDWLSGGTTGSNNSVGLWMNASAYPYPGGTGTCIVTFKNDSGNPNQTTFACTAGTPPPVYRAAGARVSISGTPSAPSWSGGVGTFSANAVLERADTRDGPYSTVNIGVAPQDKEGVKLSSFDMDADNNTSLERASLGSTALRFGRLRLFNALGPAELDLPIPMRTEYWNGATFVTNTDDNCTKLPSPANNILLSNYVGGITSANMPPGNFTTGSSFSSGVGSLILKKPTVTPGTKGSVDVCVDLSSDPAAPTSAACALTSAGMPWLQGRWSSSAGYNYDPKIRATFGVYRGAPIIYLREMY